MDHWLMTGPAGEPPPQHRASLRRVQNRMRALAAAGAVGAAAVVAGCAAQEHSTAGAGSSSSPSSTQPSTRATSSGSAATGSRIRQLGRHRVRYHRVYGQRLQQWRQHQRLDLRQLHHQPLDLRIDLRLELDRFDLHRFDLDQQWDERLDADRRSVATTAPPSAPRVVRRVPGWQRVAVDRTDAGPLLRLPPGTLLDLGATAKAWAADRCADRVATAVDGGVLVNLGGDIATAGRRAERRVADRRARPPGPSR